MQRKAVLLLSLLSLIGTSFVGLPKADFSVKAEDAPLSTLPVGWNVAVTDETGEALDTPYLSASAYLDASKGHSLKLSRRISNGVLKAYSTAFAANAEVSYKVEASIRSDCLDDEENHIVLEVVEKKTDGSSVTSSIYDLKGRQNGWKDVYGYFQTSADCVSVTLNVIAKGYGDFYLSNVSMRGTAAPTYLFGAMATETAEDQSTQLLPLASSWLVDDAFSGEKSLHLNNTGIKINLGNIPMVKGANYRLRMKMKNDSQASTFLSVRMDHVMTSSLRAWYINNGAGFYPKGSPLSDWTAVDYPFVLKDDTYEAALNWMQIFSKGEFWLDDIEILDESGFNYFADGGFEAYDYFGFSLSGLTGFTKSEDGSFNFAGANSGYSGKSSGMIQITNEQLGLEEGKTYTLSYETRGGADSVGIANYNGTKIASNKASQDWEAATGTFTAVAGQDLSITFSNWSAYLAYIRNISVKDEEGNEHANISIAEHVTSGDLGDNEFPYGEFEYTSPEEPGSSSSSEDSFSREDPSEDSSKGSSESQTSSEPTHSSEASSDSSAEPAKPDNDNPKPTSKASALEISLSVSVLAVATAGLGLAIFLLLRGKKHVK